MKKYININAPLEVLSKNVRKDYFKGRESQKSSQIRDFEKTGLYGISKLRRLVFIVLFLSSGLKVVAPDANSLLIFKSPGIQPFSGLMYATGMVETMGNIMAYNEFENAVGIFQIRQVRIDDYNRKTGSNYSLPDMFDPVLSEKVFLYFASQIGPYNLEKIARTWNGSGPMTEFYWRRIKEYME